MSRAESLRKQLIRGGIGGGLVRVSGALLGIALTVVLARTLGADGLGVYGYVYGIVMLLAIPAQLGFPTLVVRETAKLQVRQEWALMLGLWRVAAGAAGLAALLTVAAAGAVAWVVADRGSPLQSATFYFGLLLVPMITLGNLRGAALKGLRRIAAGEMPELVVRPGAFMALALVVSIAFAPLTPDVAMALHVGAGVLAFVLGGIALKRACPSPLFAVARPRYETRIWIRAAVPLSLLTAIQVVNQYAPLVVLGVLRPPEDVGVYRVVTQAAMFVVFGLQIVNVVASPYIARLHSAHEPDKLRRLVAGAARASILFAAPIALLFIVLGDQILAIAFGSQFAVGYRALAILCLGQLVNAAAGPVGYLLTMTGHVRQTVVAIGVGMVVNVLLTVALAPSLGLEGAAIATATALVSWNVSLWWFALKRLGIDSCAIPVGRLLLRLQARLSAGS